MASRNAEAHFRALLISGIFYFGLALASSMSAVAPAQAADAVQTLVDAYAGGAVADGDAVGVAVAVVHRRGQTRYFTYGNATLGAPGRPSRPVTTHSLFEIASLTKVFTTNLLGQAVANGEVRLSDKLSQYQSMLGQLQPLKGNVTLGELGDFTSGFTDSPPICRGHDTPSITGCVPYYWPPVDQYGAADFMTFIHQTQLMNWQASPPQPLTGLPAPYHYSNVGNGLLGLILGTPSGQAISDDSLSGWYSQVNDKILQPLAMTETFLDVPSSLRRRIVLGYNLATAIPIVGAGHVTRINLTQKGSGYDPDNPPQVEILGGGGSGATAEATVNSYGEVSAVGVTAAGSGYTAPAEVYFKEGGNQPYRVNARVLVANGAVTAVYLRGAVVVSSTPTVTIVGGRGSAGSQQATAVANVLNGVVQSLTVTNGGAGYVDPLTIVLTPGGGITNPTFIGGASGFLKSSIRDMANFTRAALGVRRIAGAALPSALVRGFKIAERPYACEGPDPSLSSCTTGARAGLSALAWNVVSGAEGPTVIGKNGGLPGFTSRILLSPDLDAGVVVLSTSNINSLVGDHIAQNIFYGLYSAGVFTPSGEYEAEDAAQNQAAE